MERRLFSWKAKHNGEFWDCVLKVAVGTFPVGTHVDSIGFDFDIKTIRLYRRSGGLMAQRKMQLEIL